MAVQDRYQTFLRDQREMFDALITEDWETYLNADWDQVRRFEVACLFDRVRPETVLDIGCGCGFHDQVMAGYDFVREVHAIDYSAKSIERANESYPHAKVTRGVSDLQVDEAPGRYDLVVSFQVFEHLAQPDAYFRFCKSACKPGGTTAILTPNRLRLPNALRLLKGQKPLLCDPQHFREYTVKDLRRMAMAHGLEAYAAFGYGMGGMRWIDRRPIQQRMSLGHRFPLFANGIGVLMRLAAAGATGPGEAASS
jgi:2-polyprenyl-3-methyl-5-hydroxy-6-metoxy-1,4-benzoquinol methylase